MWRRAPVTRRGSCRLNFWTVQDALRRLTATLGQMPDWSTLEMFLPGNAAGQELRAAVASTLVASLEMARGGGRAVAAGCAVFADPAGAG